MRSGQWFVLGVAAVLVFWMVGGYNRLVAMRSAIGEAWRQLDELLQHRDALAAALSERVAPALEGEQGALEAWRAARAARRSAADELRLRPLHAGPATALAAAEATLAAATARVLALLEQQPRLDEEAQRRLAGLQDLQPRIAFARQVFNEAAKAYDEAIAEVPTRWLARLYRFAPAGRL